MNKTVNLFDAFSSRKRRSGPPIESKVCETREFFHKDNLLFLLAALEKQPQKSNELAALYNAIWHYFNSCEFDRGFCKVSYSGSQKYILSTGKIIGRIYASTESKFGPHERRVGLQSFPRWIRNLLGGVFYWDLDIQNAHPTILLSLIAKYKSRVLLKESVSSSNERIFHNLTYFVRNRSNLMKKFEERLHQIGLELPEPSKQLKRLFTINFYGGTLKTWMDSEKIEEDNFTAEELELQMAEESFSLKGLREELKQLAQIIWKKWIDLIAEDNEEDIDSWLEIKNKLSNEIEAEREREADERQQEFGLDSEEYVPRNTEFRFLSLILQHKERKCLEIIDSVLEAEGRHMDVYIHDGGLVRKKYRLANNDKWRNVNPLTLHRQNTNKFTSLIWESEFPANLVVSCEKEIKERLQIEVKLVVRNLDEEFGLNRVKSLILPQPAQQQDADALDINAGAVEEDQNNYISSLLPENLSNKYLTRSYSELFYYYNTREGIAFITDSGCYVDAKGHIMSEEMFKRSLPYKTCHELVVPVSNRSKKPRTIDFLAEYTRDNNRNRFSSMSFMIEDEYMEEEEENQDPRIFDDDGELMMDYIFRQTSRHLSIQRLMAGKENTFDSGLPNVRYLFSSMTGWPIFQKSKISPTLSYNSDTKLDQWISLFRGFIQKLNLVNLFSFEPLFEIEELERELLRKLPLQQQPSSQSNSTIHPSHIPFLNHLFLLTGRNTKLMIFVLKYFALIAQHPNRRYGGTGLVFFSKGQGTGKSLFIKLMFLLFDPFTAETHDLAEDLFGRFSPCIEEKVLLHIEDVPGDQLSKFKEYLKGSITADTTRIERKGKDPYRVSNFCRYVISTNIIEKLGLETKDRRWSLVPCSDEISSIAANIVRDIQLEHMYDENNSPQIIIDKRPSQEVIDILEDIAVPLDTEIMSNKPKEQASIDSNSKDNDDEEDTEVKNIKKRYFTLLNLYFRRSIEVQVSFFKLLKNDVNVVNFHPEQNCPVKIESVLEIISPKLFSLESQRKVSSFEVFFLGVGNYFFLHEKDRHLFPKYIPKMKKDTKTYLKEFVWIPSTELLTFYKNWLASEYPKERPMNATSLCSKLKYFGTELNPNPKDYSSMTLSHVRHLPIDWKFWRSRLQELDFDQNFTINLTKIATRKLNSARALTIDSPWLHGEHELN